MKKTVLILLLFIGGLGAWAYASRFGDEQGDASQRYRTEPAQRGPIVASVAATGTVTATTTVIVGSQLSGQVVELLADHNSQVKAGQVLARLNNDTLLAKRDAARADLAQAQATRRLNDAQTEKGRAELLRAEAQRRDVQAQLQRSNAMLADAELTLQRQDGLKARGIASDVALQAAKIARETQIAAKLSAEAQIASSGAQIASIQADIKVVEAQKGASDTQIARAEAVVRQIEVDLANSEIRSPVDGVVVQRNVELGQTVAASLQAPTLFLVAQDLRRIEVYVNLDETDVGRVKAGQSVEFSVNAHLNRTFSGKVKLVRLGSQTVQNVVIYTTIVEVENDDMALLPGMTANLRIFTERKPDVLRIPNAALRWQPAGTPRAPTAAAGGASGLPDSGDSAPTAERPAGRAGGNGGAQMAQAIDSLKSQLGLSPDQSNAVDALATTLRETIARAGSDPGARQEAARSARQRFNRDLETLLKPEQKETFNTIRARQQARASGGGGSNAPRAALSGVPGRVYILDEHGAPRMLSLRLGASDGTFTEVLGGELKPGAGVITGLAATGKGARPASSFRFGL